MMKNVVLPDRAVACLKSISMDTKDCVDKLSKNLYVSLGVYKSLKTEALRQLFWDGIVRSATEVFEYQYVLVIKYGFDANLVANHPKHCAALARAACVGKFQENIWSRVCLANPDSRLVKSGVIESPMWAIQNDLRFPVKRGHVYSRFWDMSPKELVYFENNLVFAHTPSSSPRSSKNKYRLGNSELIEENGVFLIKAKCPKIGTVLVSIPEGYTIVRNKKRKK